MSLANLTINVNANTGAAVIGLRDVGAAARTAMQGSSDAVDDFRQNLLRASDSLQVAARQMGAGMQAANDAIVSSSNDSASAIDSIGEAAKNLKFDSLSAKVATAMAAAMGGGFAAVQTWTQKTEDWIETKVKAIAIGVGITAVSVTAGAVYAAYRIVDSTFGFLKGLITGDAYKSPNIDALIAMNREVLDLQKNLHVAAQDAAALRDALNRKGVSQSDYVAAYEGATKAMRSNGEELDRLGIKYKDANGNLLDQQAVLQNVKKALDEYAEGWDRDQAAASIGAGSYDQISNALKINQQEIEKSRDRLNDYLLGIGPETQKAVDDYQQAMRDFDNETKLTSEGFKRALVDNIMPALTQLAGVFTEGFPVAVRAFRYSLATVTSLFYGLATVAEIVGESVLGSIESIAIGTTGLVSAVAKAVTGDLSGAKDVLIKSWEDAKARFFQIGDNIVDQARKNRDAMAMAWALDDRGAPGSAPKASGKTWTPAPPKPEATRAAADNRDSYAAFLQTLDRMVQRVNESEYAMLRLEAAQKAAKEGITDLSGAYDRINKLQRADSQRVVEAYTQSLQREVELYKAQTAALGMTSVEQEVYTFATQKRLAVEEQIAQAKKSSKPLDDQAIADLRAQTEATIALQSAQIRARDTLSRSADFGMNKALQDYARNAGDQASRAADLVNGSFQRMEDAIVEFTHTGKLNLGNLFQFMADEFIRQQARMAIAAAAKGFQTGGLGGMFSAIGGLFGGGSSGAGASTVVSDTPVLADTPIFAATGTNYVERDGQLAILHKGEAVVPAAYNPAAGGKGMGDAAPVVNVTNHIGAGIQRNELAPILSAFGDRIKGEILLSLQSGGTFARAARRGVAA